MTRWLGAVLAISVAAGCSSTGDAGPSACVGARPAFESCLSGVTWADCGGTAEAPVFACLGGSSFLEPACRWFSGGCVPEGWVASPCPADDLCCIDGYPFGPEVSGSGWVGAVSWIDGWGSQPRDRDAGRVIDVALAPLAPTDPSVTCTGSLEGPCTAARGARWTSQGEVFVLYARSSMGVLTWFLAAEVTRDADDSLHARVCRVRTTDYESRRCGSVPSRSPNCAVSGTLTLDAFPATDEEARSTRVDLQLSFADGSTLDSSL